ncbi:hypothetical protein ASD64_01390 [Mesorhizobium sp. Root157]|uniref:hypothetical protein n=1 Tax=Mesorhizobium sp. Root157 TaxID=1736477 RepID=UPI0006FFCB42|nr:hypothetical protein [Mesorhizobium sp. Root157]KRA00255.1 hypothetical protein ASD64_01390 [Mesorhizobium sp. Root157]
MKLSEGELIWHGEYPPACVERVRADIAINLDDDLDKPSDLVFHIVFLDEHDEKIVTVWGVEGSPALHCKYDGEAEWVPVSELDD